MQKLYQQTLNFTDEHIANIAAMFPHCVTEVEDENGTLKKAIDFDLLKQELSANIVEGPKERYRIDWPGKRASLVAANTPITKTLRPAVEESVNFDTTENLYIEGDNLEALKLLQESYLGAIKMIYIDPPYNTGKDFVYKDNFTRSKEEELEASGQVDEEGGRLVANLESNGRFHSDWLSMMYPRLRLARNLLKDDGVIFISIDDNEVHNLRKICDEVFGEDNELATLSVVNNLKGRSDDEFFATCNEFNLVYAKNKNMLSIHGFALDEEELDNDYELQDEIGYYKLIGLRKTGKGWERHHRPYMYYPILKKDDEFKTISELEYKKIYDSKTKIFDDEYVEQLISKYQNDGYSTYLPIDSSGNKGRWRWGYERFKKEKEINVATNNSNTLCSKMRATLEDGSIRMKTAKTLWYKPEYDTGSSSKILKELFHTKTDYFNNPKSIYFLKDLLSISLAKEDIVLDFFSGSATTAHAVMQLNAEDGGNRKFIMVQIPEATDEKSEAYKAGYKTIAEIGKERIRRAGKKIVEENADKEGIEDLDIGFRVLKIDESNMKDIYFSPDAVDRASLFDTVDHIKEDRTPEDLLFGVLVDWGVDLTLPIRRESIHGKTVFFIGHDDLTACFDEDLDIEFIKALANRDAMRVVFKESGFKDDETKINAEQIFTQLSPGTDLRVI